MAKIIGCINTSHVPAIGRALAMHQEGTDYWKSFSTGFHRFGNGSLQFDPISLSRSIASMD